MKLRLLFFAGLRDSVGSPELLHDVGSARTIRELRANLAQHYPDLGIDSVRVAVNEEFVDADHVLRDADVVAFIPPVSGG